MEARAAAPDRREPRALFRWPGGKSYAAAKIVPMIKAYLARTEGAILVSPFFGSGAIERVVGGDQVAADACPELLGLYEDLQVAGPDAVHAALLELDARTPRTTDAYRALREESAVVRGALAPPVLRSARFLWLSAMCFNGVWRVNARAVMNMPPDPARLASKTALPPVESARAFAERIRRTTFFRGWEAALLHCGSSRYPGPERCEIIFVDPPYAGAGAFRSYTAAGFDDGAQRMLALRLRVKVEQGCALIAYNSPAARHYYEGWCRVEEGTRVGTVSSDAADRGAVAELIFTAGLEGDR